MDSPGAGDQREQFLDHQRRQSERGFVQDQQPGLGHQAPADGQHLLFAAGHGAGQLAQALAQPGKGVQHLFQIGARRARARA